MPSVYSHLQATHCNNLLALIELELPSALVKCPEINGSLQYEALRDFRNTKKGKKMFWMVLFIDLCTKKIVYSQQFL